MSSEKGKSITDIAKPGTTTEPGSSRPIIVTNRPIVKDPMVVVEVPSIVDEVSKDSLKPKKGGLKTIEPLSAPLLPDDEVKVEVKTKVEPKAGPKVETVPQPAKAEPNNEAESIEVKLNPKPEATPPAKIDPPKAADKEAEAPPAKKEVAAEDQAEVEAKPAPAEADKTDQPDQTADAEETEKTDKNTQLDIEAEEAAKEAERQAAIDKLIESKKYSLPINSVEKRRNRRFSLVGVIVCLLLALTWLDIALDAGLIRIGGIHALTHFFSVK